MKDFSVNLTEGNIIKGLVKYSLPLMAGNIFQQLYNIVDTLVVGRFIGGTALAAVGFSYTLMIFLISFILGLSMGSGAFLSIAYGKGERDDFEKGIFMSSIIIGFISIGLMLVLYGFMDPILNFLKVPEGPKAETVTYLKIIGAGIIGVYIYNYLASVLRAVGNSFVPLIFLVVGSLVNIGLDLYFVISLHMGVFGAGLATVIAQYVSAVGLVVYTLAKEKGIRVGKGNRKFSKPVLKSIMAFSILTGLQQSVMNFGILLVQGRVNSFGTKVMAAFSIAVKIDTLAYSPVQDFGNGFSTFIGQNYGRKNFDRMDRGTKSGAKGVLIFCLAVSALVFIFSYKLMGIFTLDKEIAAIGAVYLKIEGAFYCLIGFLFMFYGYFRGRGRAGISLILTIISLGTRVALAFALSSVQTIGYLGIWVSIPIGWVLADLAGLMFYKKFKKY